FRSSSHPDLPPSRIAGTNMAQAMQPASIDEIDRTRPGLMAVALRHAHIDRKVGAARERHDVIDGQAPAPILLGQTIDADPPSKTTVSSASVVRSTSPETTLVSSTSVPRRASSSQMSMPARLPVVTEVQLSAVPGEVSCTFRSGLRKFTGAKRAKRLPVSVN